VLLQHSR